MLHPTNWNDTPSQLGMLHPDDEFAFPLFLLRAWKSVTTGDRSWPKILFFKNLDGKHCGKVSETGVRAAFSSRNLVPPRDKIRETRYEQQKAAREKEGKKRAPSSNELTHQKKECVMECHGAILTDKKLSFFETKVRLH
jgi:hypothetical protein